MSPYEYNKMFLLDKVFIVGVLLFFGFGGLWQAFNARQLVESKRNRMPLYPRFYRTFLCVFLGKANSLGTELGFISGIFIAAAAFTLAAVFAFYFPTRLEWPH